MLAQTQTQAPLAHTPTTAVAVTATEPTVEKVRVKIKRSRDGQITIDSSHTPAYAHVVALYLKSPKRTSTIAYIHKYGYGGYSVQEVMPLIPSVTMEEWQEAIAREIIDRLAAPMPETTELSLIRSDAYLSMAGAVYELRPVGIVRTNNALKAFRHQITAASKKEAIKIVAEANTNAQSILTTANARLLEVNARIAEANATPAMPAWMRGLVVKRAAPRNSRTEVWCVRGTIDFTIQYFEAITLENYSPRADQPPRHHNVRRVWAPTPAPSIKVGIWVPIQLDGTFTIASIHVDSTSPQLPHMSWEYSCMSLQSGPALITNARQLNDLCHSIQDCLSGVNLSSLLVHVNNWEKRILDFAPANSTLLGAEISRMAPPLTITRTPSDHDDATETWRTT